MEPREQRVAQAANRIERRALLLLDALEDKAARIVAALDEPPVNSVPLPPDRLRAMFAWSPFRDAAAEFWRQHDQLFQQAAAAGDPDPAATAEQGALDTVYPYRGRLAAVGAGTLEVQVKRAERLRRLMDSAANAHRDEGEETMRGVE